MLGKVNIYVQPKEPMVRACPYCGAETGGKSDGIDECWDWCDECDVMIEGATVDIPEALYFSDGFDPYEYVGNL
jgi:hypothetical protein